MGKLNIDKMNKSFYGSLKKDIPSKKENLNPNQDERILQILDENIKRFKSPKLKEFWYNKGEGEWYDNKLKEYEKSRKDWVDLCHKTK